MPNNNFISLLRNIDNGLCNNCDNPKGHIESEQKCFCYKCAGYELLDREEAIQIINRNKRRIREEFKKIAVKSDIFYCLKVFLSIGETFLDPTGAKREGIFIIDPRRIAIANIAVKWLLEDSLDHLQEIVPRDDAYLPTMMNLARTWLDWNRKEKLSDRRYSLGYFIKKAQKISFYYTQQFDFYLESLEKFNITGSPEEINEDIIKNVQNLNKDLFQDPDRLQKYVRDEYPVLISTVLNSYHIDEDVRPFSFDEFMDKDNRKMVKFISSFADDLTDYVQDKKIGIDKFILALLENLYSFYYGQRSKSFDEDGYVIVRNLDAFVSDITRGGLLIPPLEEYIISSSKNPQKYPIIVEYNGKYIISPLRLWMGYRILHYAVDKDRINSELAEKYERESLIQTEKRLRMHGVVIVGKGISTSKKGFELDFIGYYKDFIFIIECKSFHPSPFFIMRKKRRYKNQFRKKVEKIDRISKWIFSKLSVTIPKKGKIRVNVYNPYKKCGSEIIFPMKYHKIDRNKILYLYISQLKEYHQHNRNDLIQVWIGDLLNLAT